MATTEQQNAPAAGEDSGPRLGLVALTALVIGSMVGAGIFSIPQNMAAGPSAPGALLIGWAITGVGMLALALTFQYLGHHAKNPRAGLHGYARDGFGPLPGFLSAWGYWISAWLGNLAYLVLIFATLGMFIPAIGDGTTWWATAGESVVLWLYTLLLLRGVREASSVNVAVTIAKLVPLAIFLVIVALNFDPAVFTADLWGTKEGLGSVMDQVTAMMLVTVWAFLGIEGASVYAGRAQRREDVGRATVIGFLLVISLLVAVNLLSAGILRREELAELADPSLAGVLESVVGPWGAVLISIGLLISLSGALLAWMMYCAEILSSTARERAMPAALAREPRPGVPRTAILLTTVVLQIALVWVHFAGAGYYDLILMAGSMILVPYLLSAGYALQLALRSRRGERADDGDGATSRSSSPSADSSSPTSHTSAPTGDASARRGAPNVGRIVLMTGFALVYAMWLIYAGGLDYLLMSTVFYVIGLAVHAWTRRENNRAILHGRGEWVIAGVVLLAGLAAIYGFATGSLAV